MHSGASGQPRALSFYVKVEGATFGRGDHEKFRNALQEAARTTHVTDAYRWQDLALSREYALADGYRFTQAGLSQVCSLLAPGLFRLILDVSGAFRNPFDQISAHSPAEAAAIYNRVLALRFGSAIAEKVRLVRNSARRTVDGVIGTRYVMLSNAVYFGHIERLLQEAQRAAVFFEASMAGRRLSVRFVDQRGLARGPDGSVWHSGLWFCNSEIGGESPVCGSTLLCNPVSRACALGPLVGGKRVIHTGRDFDRRVGSLFKMVDVERIEAEGLRAAFAQLGEKTIALPADLAARERATKRLAQKLAAKNVPQEVARRAVVSAMHAGGLDETLPLLPQTSGRKTFSHYDLYTALAGMGKSRHSALRERIERAAFSLLNLKQP
jgi:hypothetical protein